MGVDREPLGPECRQKDGSRPPGLAFAHERGTLVRHPRGPTGYKAVRRNAAQTQRGRSRYRPHSASRGEETTLDTVSLIQGPTGYKAVRRNAAQTQRGRSRYRPHSASRGEETTLDTVNLIQGALVRRLMAGWRA